MKAKRFFFHFRKTTGELTLHWNKKCIPIKNIRCEVPVETKWNTIQPKVVLQGFAKYAIINEDEALMTNEIPIGMKEYLSNTGEWKDVLLPSEWEEDTKIRIKKL